MKEVTQADNCNLHREEYYATANFPERKYSPEEIKEIRRFLHKKAEEASVRRKKTNIVRYRIMTHATGGIISPALWFIGNFMRFL